MNAKKKPAKTSKKNTVEPVQFRQGDVFIHTPKSVPTKLVEVAPDPRGVVLAEGEATGHHHRIGPSFRNAVLLRTEDGLRSFLRVTGGVPASLKHEEHAPISIPPGLHEVYIQREYQPDGVRQVVD